MIIPIEEKQTKKALIWSFTFVFSCSQPVEMKQNVPCMFVVLYYLDLFIIN